MPEVKEFLTYDEQIQHLLDSGLSIDDKEYAKSVLSQVNYYRLINAYSLGLYCERKPKDKYRPGVTFFQIYDLYKFDIDLRHILSELLEAFEIIFRTKVAYYIGSKYGPLGYLEQINFETEAYHLAFVEDFKREKKHQAKSPIVKHHEDKYHGEMPIWAAVEVVSFGTISKLYTNMKKADRAAIAKDLGTSEKHLRSWLRSFVEVRNICAHYGRVYNKILLSQPKLYNDVSFSNKRIFCVLFLLKRFIDAQDWTSLMLKLERSLEQHSYVELDKIGFPANWKAILKNDL